jgi:hypothetical protein
LAGDTTTITGSQASAITANTAKTVLALGTSSSTALAGDTTTITSGQASAITANTAKTGITSGQASAITANTAKTVLTLGTTSTTALAGDTTTITGSQASAITANTAKTVLALGTSSSTALAGDTTTITSSQANAITENTEITQNTTGISPSQASAITANTAKTGITSGQASAITANTGKTVITSSQASAITANTAKVGMTLGTTSSTALAGNALSGTVNIGQTGATTTVLGTLNVDEAVTLDTTLSVTGVSTFSGATALNGDVQIGNSASDKIGFFGATTAVRSSISDVTNNLYLDVGGVTCPYTLASHTIYPHTTNCTSILNMSTAIVTRVDLNSAKINELITQLQALGLIN